MMLKFLNEVMNPGKPCRIDRWSSLSVRHCCGQGQLFLQGFTQVAAAGIEAQKCESNRNSRKKASVSQSCFELGLGRHDCSAGCWRKGAGIIVCVVRNIWGCVCWTLLLPHPAHAHLALSEGKAGARKPNSLRAVSSGEVQAMAELSSVPSCQTTGGYWRRWQEGEGLQCLLAE